MARRYDCSVAVDIGELPFIANLTLFKRVVLFANYISEYYLVRSVQLNIIVSTYLKERLLKMAPNSSFYICPAVVDTNLFDVGNEDVQCLKNKIGLDNKIVVAYLGSFYWPEGVDIMLRAFSRLHRDLNP